MTPEQRIVYDRWLAKFEEQHGVPYYRAAKRRQRGEPIVLTPMPCSHCRTEFMPERSNMIYCSARCKWRAWRKKRAKERVAKSPVLIQCGHCRTAFERKSNAKYCSTRCKNARSRLWRKEIPVDTEKMTDAELDALIAQRTRELPDWWERESKHAGYEYTSPDARPAKGGSRG